MRSLLLAFLAILSFSSTAIAQEADAPVLEPDPVFAESLPPDEFSRARVLEITLQDVNQGDGFIQPYQVLQVRIESGAERGKEFELEHGVDFLVQPSQLLDRGETFVLVKSYKVDGTPFYAVADKYRLPALAGIIVGFVILVVLMAGRRGLAAFLGIGLSLWILASFAVPRILDGSNPLFVSVAAAAGIAVVSTYLAHGYSRNTSLAVASSVLTALIAAALALLFVKLARLTGIGSEEAYYLQLGRADPLDLKGLLLGGMIIGVLGVLDDVTTTQVATVAELHHANPTLSLKELYQRGLRVGRAHIISLVNTLVLAYTGSSLPLFILFTQSTNPLWMTMNSEFIAEEIVRSLVGSSALVLAVPVATYLAARSFSTKPLELSGSTFHRH